MLLNGVIVCVEIELCPEDSIAGTVGVVDIAGHHLCHRRIVVLQHEPPHKVIVEVFLPNLDQELVNRCRISWQHGIKSSIEVATAPVRTDQGWRRWTIELRGHSFFLRVLVFLGVVGPVAPLAVCQRRQRFAGVPLLHPGVKFGLTSIDFCILELPQDHLRPLWERPDGALHRLVICVIGDPLDVIEKFVIAAAHLRRYPTRH
mmetsp:Transcript_44240/g.111198  ORF Transcript_44240/g.111198 Transcript_44240/m.111198 type:complete len:203 (+) Transcript_44240:307-915(+)